MIICRRSPLTGELHAWDIDVTSEQFKAWKGGQLIQHAMPNITDDEREFIMSGITPDEWDEAFPEVCDPEPELDDEEPAF